MSARCQLAGSLPSEGWEGELFHPLFLICRCLCSPYIFSPSASLSGSAYKCPLLIRSPAMLDQNPPQWPHFNLNATVKTLSPSRVTFCGSKGLGLNHLDLRRGTIQPITLGDCSDLGYCDLRHGVGSFNIYHSPRTLQPDFMPHAFREKHMDNIS